MITSKFPEREDLKKMEERVYQAVDFVAQGSNESQKEALERLGVSPKCRFASHSSGNAVTKEDVIAKLKLVHELADNNWPGEP